MCAFLGLLFASDKNIELYAIRGYAEGKDFECPENLKDIEKYLKETGLKRFSLINKDSLTAQKDSKLTLALPDNLKAEVSVEEVTKEGVVRVHIKIIREKEEKKETVLDTKYPLKEKPLLIGKIKLEEGFLLLALLLK
ncbi:MAG: hypothetical protein N2234_01450 [Planctomycetota bacterium]|nr:hypothetical protein [Planctomycetota bacterium]